VRAATVEIYRSHQGGDAVIYVDNPVDNEGNQQGARSDLYFIHEASRVYRQRRETAIERLPEWRLLFQPEEIGA